MSDRATLKQVAALRDELAVRHVRLVEVRLATASRVVMYDGVWVVPPDMRPETADRRKRQFMNTVARYPALL